MGKVRPRPKLSKPGEHGGLVTLGSGAALATLTAPRPAVALLAGLAFMVGYLARGPIERKVRRFRLRVWDWPGLVIYAVTAVASIWLVARVHPIAAAIVGLGATGIPIMGAVVCNARVQRTYGVELAGMAVCGGSAGVALYAGGAGPAIAGAVGLAMLSYAASTVALVRAEIRKPEHHAESPGHVELSRFAVLMLGAGCAATGILAPGLMVAFAPRLAHSGWRAACAHRGHPPGARRINVVATRETGELALFVVILCFMLHSVTGQTAM